MRVWIVVGDPRLIHRYDVLEKRFAALTLKQLTCNINTGFFLCIRQLVRHPASLTPFFALKVYNRVIGVTKNLPASCKISSIVE